jgi:hypothetical protein
LQVFNKQDRAAVTISSVVSQLAVTKVLGYSQPSIDSYTQMYLLELAIRYGDAIRMNLLRQVFLTEQTKPVKTGTLTDREISTKAPFQTFWSS